MLGSVHELLLSYGTLKRNTGVRYQHVDVSLYSQITFEPKYRDSTVGIAAKLRACQAGIRILAWARDFFYSPNRQDRPWGPSSVLFNGYRGSFPGVKA